MNSEDVNNIIISVNNLKWIKSTGKIPDIENKQLLGVIVKLRNSEIVPLIRDHTSLRWRKDNAPDDIISYAIIYIITIDSKILQLEDSKKSRLGSIRLRKNTS